MNTTKKPAAAVITGDIILDKVANKADPLYGQLVKKVVTEVSSTMPGYTLIRGVRLEDDYLGNRPVGGPCVKSTALITIVK